MTLVRAVELRLVVLPLRHAHRAAHGVETDRSVVLVRVELDGGVEGWGECSALSRPTYTSEYTQGAWRILHDELVPAVLGAESSTIVGHPMAAAALSSAIADAEGRVAGRALAAELAGRFGREPEMAVPWTAVVGRQPNADALIGAVGERLDAGAASIKLKASPLPTDLEGVEAVRATWPDLVLAVDFNGTADLASLARLGPLALAYVEQPAPADDLVASSRLAGAVDAPIALDESVTSVASLLSAAALGAGTLVNVKPARCGGLDHAVQIVAAAAEAGMGAFVGGMLETGIGRAASLAVAALPVLAMPTDLGPSAAYFEADVVEPLVLDGQGRLVVPLGPGIGRIPRMEVVDAHTVERSVVHR